MMEQREGYKKTKIGWIPEDWDIKKLGDIGFFKNGINKGKEDFGHGVPFVNLMDVFGYISINNKEFGLVSASSKEQENYNLIKGDVLFIRSSVKPSGVGLTVLVEEDLPDTIYSGFLIRFRPNQGLLVDGYKKYCFYDEIFRRTLLAKSSVSANTNINQNALSGLLLKLPPLPEQKKIASILTTVDDKISSIDQQIQQTEQLKKGLMEKLLTEGIGHTEFKETKIGRIPKGWNSSTLGKHIILISGQHINSGDYNENGDGISYITGPADYPNGKIIPSKFTKNPEVVCEANDILITCKGSGAGSLTVAEVDCCISRQIMAIRPKIFPQKFVFTLLERAQNIFRKNAVGIIPGINRPDLINFSIPCPPIEEQKQIATILSTVDDKIDVLTQKKTHYQTLKKGLSQQLLTGQMRVKI